MAIKIFPYLFALFALIFLVQAAPRQENELPDVLYIENPDTSQAVLSAQEALTPVQRNRVCFPAQCAQTCRRLGFRRGWCNANRVCNCSR